MKGVLEKKVCYHCGDTCADEVLFDKHTFCCTGCKTVYELLSSNNLCDYYNLETAPGITQKNSISKQRFTYLDDIEVQKKLIDFRDDNITKFSLFIPAMHCSSCIWLLEHLYKLDTGVHSSRVNFLKKTVTITFKHKETSIRKIAELLTTLGYEPAINLNDIETQVKKSENRRLSYQIGVAGFCFGNIMLVSFPEYFGLDDFTRHSFSKLFGYLNLVLSLPVFFFSAQDYFKNAINGLRKKYVNIDVPLALGILVLFVRSFYEVTSHTGIGYFDTLAGLVFFLLIGKWFQQKTFDTLSFERDYKSYFPVAVSVIKNGAETSVPVTALNIGDRIVIRNGELIPADSILLKGEAYIDFSFVTGESNPVPKVLGEIIYAGGRQTGQTIELSVCKKVSQSYLTQLWNSEHFAKNNERRIHTFQQTVSKYFTVALLIIALSAATWWLIFNPSLALHAFTSVLIIACPCALALSSPFALGTAMRILGRNRFYLKSSEVVEQIAKTDIVVFDKTGTITRPGESKIIFVGDEPSEKEKNLIVSLAWHSIHPLSRRISLFFPATQLYDVSNYKEINGKGIEGTIYGKHIQLGSLNYLFPSKDKPELADTDEQELATRVFVKVNNKLLGYFQIAHTYRPALRSVINKLEKEQELYLLSGDNSGERDNLNAIFRNNEHLYFNQSPIDKLNFIDNLQEQQKHVLMIGDGLNDAGALKAANVGISVTEDTAHFSPASDVIMDAGSFHLLPDFIKFSRNTVTVIHLSFVISLIYNIIGLSFAVQGTLSPLIAAILMPVSSVTIIAFTTTTTLLFANKRGLQ